MNNQMQNFDKKRNNDIDDEIDLDYLLDLIKRNKYLISSISLLSFFLFVIYAILQPKKWQGSFQIVLSENNDQSNLPQNAIASNLMNRFKGNFNLNSTRTEVGILGSPYVLKPVFDYVNEEHKKSNPGSKNLIFQVGKR